MQTNWPQILRKCSQKVREEVIPLIKTDEGRKTFGIGAGGDQMKRIDLVAEEAITKTLEKHKVSCTLISEESGVKKIGDQPSKFYVTTDPLDGTTNAIRGAPFIATSIAVSKTTQLQNVETALVSDLLHNITYTAQQGKGASRNGQKIKPSQLSSLEEAVLGVDFNTYKTAQVASQLTRVLEKTKHFRHFGANALELCYVADGTTEAFLDIRGKLRVTDIAAAYLILLEAGGAITAPKGNKLDAPLTPTQRVSFIATGNPRLHKKITELLTSRKE
jgi:myo-inositol-1(or 4)-monophosphatase